MKRNRSAQARRSWGYMKSAKWLSVSLTALLISILPSDAVNVSVDARCNIFGSGHTPPADTPSVVGGGGIPPIEIAMEDVGTSGELTFRAVGTVTFKPGEPYNGPDGDGVYYSVPEYSGISGINAIRRSLVGVFLSDAEPASPAPPPLDFAVIGKDYADISPALNQVFYIGDGVHSGTGEGQKIIAPAGATRLFLGFVDGFGADVPGWYDDNLGAFLVSVTEAGADGAVDAPYVSAKCNIFGSGHLPPNDTPSIAGGGGNPPIVIDLDDLSCGSVLSFGATGLVSYDSTLPFNGPDGDGPFYAVPGYNGVSGINAPRRSLIGVFVSDIEPTDPPPPSLDFSGGGINYVTLSPVLNQMFFIGDGVANASGNLQYIKIPEGATRLCLGVVDGFGTTQVPGWYDDNRGGFLVRVVRSADGTEEEVCNGMDDDCDGLVDEGAQSTFYRDADGDGFGDLQEPIESCTLVEGYVEDSTDCDDSKGTTYPGAPELCNGLDDDCDGEVDEDVQVQMFYRDADGDGFGNAADMKESCDIPEGYVTDATDCNDLFASIYPGAPELCNGVDDDCDGEIDEGVKQTFYRDADQDGYGDASMPMESCEAPDGYVTDATDCDDDNAAVNPGAAEVCNGIDDDCDGEIDEGLKQTFYRDADQDGYGDASMPMESCEAPDGYVRDATDCDDGNVAVNPGATEVCNGIDDDCDGVIDEGCGDDDADDDGVPDTVDQCPDTPSGSVVNSEGCSLDQLVPCDGPWKNHGEYVSTVAKVTLQFVNEGVLSTQQRAVIVSTAARSDCGKKPKR